MKKITHLTALLSLSLAASAQDTYWPLADNKIYNTATGTVFNTTQALSPSGGFGFDGDAQVVFDANGYLLFTGGPNSPNFKMANMGQVIFPVPNDCKRFITIRTASSTTPHGHSLEVKKIDATGVSNNINTTGLPQYISFSTPGFNPNLFAGADATDYSITASRLNSDGTRYFYHLNRPASSSTATLYRYTVNNMGELTNPTSPTVITNSLPPGVHLRTSQDGQSVGYIRSSDGKFVTYQLYGSYTVHNTFAVNLAGGYTPGIEQVTIGGNRIWVVGDNDQAGYVVEGNAAYDDIQSGGMGLYTSFALGRDGMMYFAFSDGGAASGDGELRKLEPADLDVSYNLSQSTLVSGAYIRATNWNGTSYLFGNHIAGEDINSASAPIYAPTFTLNGQTSTPTTATNIYLCTGQDIQLILSAHIPGLSAYGILSVDLGQLTDEGFVTDIPLEPVDGTWYGVAVADLFDYYDLLRNYSGHIKVRFDTYSPCGNLLSSIEQVFNLIQAGAAVDFFLIGPNDCSSSPVCNYLGTSYVSLQNIVTNRTTVDANRPSQPVSDPPPCVEGWTGDGSAGISKGVLTLNNTSPSVSSPYNITVDELDNTGGFIKNIITASPALFPAAGWHFYNKTNPPHYFTNNYATIKDNYYYRVKVSVITQECGEYFKTAYFKILDGGDEHPCPGTWRQAGSQPEYPEFQKTVIFPNPATGEVHVNWHSPAEHNGAARISVIDILGKVVIQKELPQAFGTNDALLDISMLTPGVYHYLLKTSNDTAKGSLVKQ